MDARHALSILACIGTGARSDVRPSLRALAVLCLAVGCGGSDTTSTSTGGIAGAANDGDASASTPQLEVPDVVAAEYLALLGEVRDRERHL
jgi:hypothetical protein